MIFYFSGTGNSAWAARQLARLTDDTACDITQLNELPDLTDARQIGFVFPIYAWGVPEIMADFAKKLPKTQAFTFGVCTCGEDAGHAMKRFSRLYPLSSSYSLVMPNNYIVGSDTDGEDEILKKIAAAREELGRMAQEIRRQERVYRVREGAMAGFKSGPVNYGFNKFARSAKPLLLQVRQLLYPPAQFFHRVPSEFRLPFYVLWQNEHEDLETLERTELTKGEIFPYHKDQLKRLLDFEILH